MSEWNSHVDLLPSGEFIKAFITNTGMFTLAMNTDMRRSCFLGIILLRNRISDFKCQEFVIGLDNGKILGKFPNIWKLSNMFLNNPWVKKEIKRKLGRISELN